MAKGTNRYKWGLKPGDVYIDPKTTKLMQVTQDNARGGEGGGLTYREAPQYHPNQPDVYANHPELVNTMIKMGIWKDPNSEEGKAFYGAKDANATSLSNPFGWLKSYTNRAPIELQPQTNNVKPNSVGSNVKLSAEQQADIIKKMTAAGHTVPDSVRSGTLTASDMTALKSKGLVQGVDLGPLGAVDAKNLNPDGSINLGNSEAERKNAPRNPDGSVKLSVPEANLKEMSEQLHALADDLINETQQGYNIMKMNDIVVGEGGRGVLDTIRNAADIAGDGIKAGYKYLTKPTQYSNKLGQTADTIAKDIEDKTNAVAKMVPTDPGVKQIEKVNKQLSANLEKLVQNSNGRLQKEIDNTGNFTGKILQNLGNDRKGVPIIKALGPDEFSALQRTAQAGAGTVAAVGTGSATSDDPYATARDTMTDLVKVPLDVTKGLVGGAVGTLKGMLPGSKKPETKEVDQFEMPPNDLPKPTPPKEETPPKEKEEEQEKVDTNESISDILKLSGQRAITSRDNVAGITKTKEIVALHESKLEECGMGMMSNMPNTPATLNISATAGSGEEVANMLASIMKLAGVREVTPDMLGGATLPMPIVKAIDIISRGELDSMNGHDHEEPLTGMEEDYANTPADPTDVPDFDSNKMAYQPNNVETGDRMDGNMPKGKSSVTQESLLQAYAQYKNVQ